MANCGQAYPYNTLDGCKVKEYNVICPLTNMATPVTEYRMTNADRIRAMSDEELAEILVEEKEYGVCHIPFFRCPGGKDFDEDQYEDALRYTIDWLKQPAEE